MNQQQVILQWNTWLFINTQLPLSFDNKKRGELKSFEEAFGPFSGETAAVNVEFWGDILYFDIFLCYYGKSKSEDIWEFSKNQNFLRNSEEFRGGVAALYMYVNFKGILKSSADLQSIWCSKPPYIEKLGAF